MKKQADGQLIDAKNLFQLNRKMLERITLHVPSPLPGKVIWLSTALLFRRRAFHPA